MTKRPPDSLSAFRLLTRLFVRRFVEQESLSPHADRVRTFAVAYGLVVTAGVFYTFFLCIDYLSALVQLPGPAAVRALSDRFMYIAASMATAALATLAVWDALALEPRDAAILGALPVQAHTITRAKLTAAWLFAAVVIVLLNAGPALLYPALLTLNMRGVHGSTLISLIAAHGAAVGLAGLFGFGGILALRGIARAVLGERIFGRASAAMHGVLVIVTLVSLLLVPTVRSATVRAWIAQGDTSAAPLRPVLWFLGLNESTAGHLLVDTPVVLPPRLASYRLEDDESGRAEYRALLPALRALAGPVWWSLPLLAGIGIGTFLWTNRRLPEQARDSGPTWSPALSAVLRHTGPMDPERQAGWHFAWQVLTRSRTHRMLLAVSVAVGATHACLIALGGGLVPLNGEAPARGEFAIGLFLVGAVLAGARHALTVPATPAANWLFQTTWSGDERPYLSGVKGGVLALVGSLLVLAFPAHVLLMGIPTASAHSVIAWLLAWVALDAALLSYRRLPFVCSYIPVENPKVAWPAGICGLLALTYVAASAERWATASPVRWLALGAGLCVVGAVLSRVDGARRRERRPVFFNEPPSVPTQRLGLHDHVFGTE